LVRELNIPFINLSKYNIDPALKEVIPEKIARQYKVIPLSSLSDTITVAMSDPLNIFVVDDLKNITGKQVDIVISTLSDIDKALDNFYGSEVVETVTDISKDIDVGDFEIVSDTSEKDDVDSVLDESEKAPIIRMVNLVIQDALRKKSSDIHMEPFEDGVRVRFRIDGVLRDILTIPKANQNAVIVRIKIMSRLDITVNQTPQDGRFKLKLGSREVDFRVSVLPTTHGQKIVMRVLDKMNLTVGLGGLGFNERAFEILQEGIKKPFGMIIVTGPTGSGKSTTLYSIVNSLNSVDKNIITIEDPVEYLIEGLTQIQARPEIGLTFAEGLRAVLRQSPDVVMVGEIRDNETADIAIKASLTGQLVLSTLHTNDAPGALTRLVDMEVESFLVASSIVLVTAQRLCRKICPKCKVEEDVPKKVLDQIQTKVKAGTKFFTGKGCPNCNDTGYQGRIAVSEMLDIDDGVRNLLLEGKTSDDIKEYARKQQHMSTLWEDAMEKCLAGVTSLEEVLRVTSED
jgi:type IV pilus assembly protein PilB